jgi:hypothetical protein
MSGLSCRQARNLFDAHLNHELGDDLSTELAAHCVKCADCRQALALLEVAGQVIQTDHDEPVISDDFTNRLMACVAGQNKPVVLPFYRRTRVLWGAGAGLAAAACLLCAVTLWPDDRKQAVLGRTEDANGVVSDPADASDFDQPALLIDAAAAELQRRLQDGATSTRDGLNSLEEAGKRTILEFINASRQKDGDGASGLQQPLDELLESAEEPPAGAGDDAEIEDL